MLKILFLCTGNSCRSQMAEGLANNLFGNKVKAYSAGSNPAGFVHPLAIKVMQEIDIDISGYQSKMIDDETLNDVDYVITLCGDAKDSCPVLPSSTTKLHWDLKDPAKAEGTEEEKLLFFRKIRDELIERIKDFLGQ